MHHVVIVGGGFGGLYGAKELKRAPVEVTLLDRRNFHLFQPLLYQVATGGLSPGEIASPLRSVLKHQDNARVLLAEAVDFDVDGRRVLLNDGAVLYDSLIVATGASHHYFGHPEWAAFAPGLKTIEDATEIRARLFFAFEAAERELDPDARRAWLTFVVVGAGPTGVELAGALGEIAHDTLRRDFRSIDPREARILLLEGADRVLPPYPPVLSAKAQRALERLKVTVCTGAQVVLIEPTDVTVRRAGATEKIQSRTVLWAAGVQASPLGRRLGERTGAPLDKAGRIIVEADLSVPGYRDIFVVGDLASFSHQTGHPLPGVAPVAMQQGKFVAGIIRRRVEDTGGTPSDAVAFYYTDRGSMATIGRAAAVAEIGRFRFNGLLAWLAWLFIHLIYLIEFDNRLLVLVQWAWNYVTRNRGARLITGESRLPLQLLAITEDEERKARAS